MFDDDFQRLINDHAGGYAEVAIVVRHPDGTETQALIAKDASVILETATEAPQDLYLPRQFTQSDDVRTVRQIRVTTLGQVTLYSPEFFVNGGQQPSPPLHLTEHRAALLNPTEGEGRG